MQIRSIFWLALGLFSATLAAGAEFPTFQPQTLDPKVGEVCYAVTLADVDGDGKKDVVAVTENRVVWYHNPDWKLRVIINDQTERDNVCIAAHDIDGDGKVDFALGAGWLNNRHLGTLFWLSRGESLDVPWKVHSIGQESWTHRIRFGDLLGSGKPQLIVSPLNKTKGDGVRMLAFQIPEKLDQNGPWKSETLDHGLNAVHAHWTGDLDNDGQTDLLTASMEGVFLFRRSKQGELEKIQIGEGAPGEALAAQKTGSGVVKVGRLKGGRTFIAAVEPMHGNQAVVYLSPEPGAVNDPLAPPKLWERIVLDDTLGRGHAIWPADVDRDGSDELVLGHSDKGTGEVVGPGVFVYRAEADLAVWKKHIIDNGGIATEDLVAEDLTGDGWPDIVAGGRATHNVKLYVNRGKK
ncbi:MAG: VCBS repeat-containing protein [Planctomycetota bacterium]|nr:VCBS repeat-containing protein [Planctomycetota bacterium]